MTVSIEIRNALYASYIKAVRHYTFVNGIPTTDIQIDTAAKQFVDEMVLLLESTGIDKQTLSSSLIKAGIDLKPKN